MTTVNLYKYDETNGIAVTPNIRNDGEEIDDMTDKETAESSTKWQESMVSKIIYEED